MNGSEIRHLEANLEGILRDEVRAAGGKAIKLAPIEAGIPDRLVILGGRMWLVELKTTTGRLSPIQMRWHETVRQMGTEVVVLFGAADIREWVQKNR